MPAPITVSLTAQIAGLGDYQDTKGPGIRLDLEDDRLLPRWSIMALPLSSDEVRQLAPALYKTAKLTITIEVEEQSVGSESCDLQHTAGMHGGTDVEKLLSSVNPVQSPGMTRT